MSVLATSAHRKPHFLSGTGWGVQRGESGQCPCLKPPREEQQRAPCKRDCKRVPCPTASRQDVCRHSLQTAGVWVCKSLSSRETDLRDASWAGAGAGTRHQSLTQGLGSWSLRVLCAPATLQPDPKPSPPPGQVRLPPLHPHPRLAQSWVADPQYTHLLR